MKNTHVQSIQNIFLKLVQASAVVFFTFFILKQLSSVSYFLIYQARDLDRASDLYLHGKAIWHGPELNGGGHLIGPFYYYIMGFPLLFGFGWQEIFLFMIGLTSIGLGLIYFYFKQRFGLYAALVATTTILGSDVFFWIERQYVNSSFLPFFLILGLIFLTEYFLSYDKKKTLYLFLSVILFTLAGQLHGSAYLPIAAIILLFLYEKIKKLNTKISFIKITLFLCVFIILIVPYFFLENHLVESGFIVNSFNDFYLTIKKELLLHQGKQKLYGFFFRICHIFLIATVAYFLNKFLSNKDGIPVICDEQRRLNRFFTVLFILSLPLCIHYILIDGRARYATLSVFVLPFFIFSQFNCKTHLEDDLVFKKIFYFGSIILCFLILRILISKNLDFNFFSKVRYEALLFSIFFFIALLIQMKRAKMALISTIFVTLIPIGSLWLYLSRSNEIFPYFADYVELAKAIKNTTGWSYSEARKRIFYINTFNQATPRNIWDNVVSEKVTAKSDISGYFALLNQDLNLQPFEKLRSFTLEVISGKFGEFLKTILQTKAITLLTPVKAGRFLLFPYKIHNFNELPLYFQNIGFSYEKYPEQVNFEKKISGQEIEAIDTNNFFFRWNECPHNSEYCTIGFKLKMDTSTFEKKLHITILGAPISVPSINTLPDWTIALIRPYGILSCGRKNTKRIFTESVGYYTPSRYQLNRVHTMNHSITGPVDIVWKLHCSKKHMTIKLGWERAYLTRRLEQSIISGKEFVVSTDKYKL